MIAELLFTSCLERDAAGSDNEATPTPSARFRAWTSIRTRALIERPLPSADPGYDRSAVHRELGSDPKWLLPVLRARLADGHTEPIEVVDRQRDRVMAPAAEQQDQPMEFLHAHGARATLQAVVDRE